MTGNDAFGMFICFIIMILLVMNIFSSFMIRQDIANGGAGRACVTNITSFSCPQPSNCYKQVIEDAYNQKAIKQALDTAGE